MAFVILVSCDGTRAERPEMTLDVCRSYFPVTTTDPVAALEKAKDGGWTEPEPDKHLCYSCTKTSQVLHGS